MNAHIKSADAKTKAALKQIDDQIAELNENEFAYMYHAVQVEAAKRIANMKTMNTNSAIEALEEVMAVLSKKGEA